MGMNKSISKCESYSFINKMVNMTEITEFMEDDWRTDEMCLSMYILIWKSTPRFLAESLGDIALEPRLLILTERFTLLGLNSWYSVLFRLAYNLLDVIHENTSLIQD